MTETQFSDMLDTLGFDHDVVNDIYTYVVPNSFDMLVADFKKKELRWPAGLTHKNDTTSNFSKPENFVVFECVHRLLEMGYQPKDIELEPTWKVGHGASGGRADIMVRTVDPHDANSHETLLIIECKTFGREFNSAWKDTLEDGDQLFGYFAQEPTTKFLCLYASDFPDNKVEHVYHLINVQDNEDYLKTLKSPTSYKDGKAKGRKTLFKAWKETYKLDYATIGLFEKGIEAYHPGKSEYTVDDLKAVDAVEIGKLYHRFAETLRKYNVSGRENAFDKLVNLMLAKVVDELQNPKLQFNWKGAAYDDDFRLQDRLQKLYKEGMQKFLGEDVTYIDDSQIDQAFRRFKNDPDATRDTVRKYVRQLKFFTNNDFAFIDVHNEKLFNQNSVVLRDVVKMLQDIRLRTDSENQFLGDLFENFLDQGVKQSEGQFFTPIPYVRFMVSSLPVAETLDKMSDPPIMVDYACGAGHFLNEYARQVTAYVQKKLAAQAANKKGGKVPEDIHALVKDYFRNIFGIEKEYRLSKVSKVASFMYGQDEIKIIYADALIKNGVVKDGTVKFLFTNPPYSVKGFLETLTEEQRNQFRLTENVSDLAKNNSIECFFIERAAQLLAPGGMAAIVLPSSILNNGNLYVKCREILIESFDIVAIVEMGSGTFGKTNTSTATLFLRRKANDPDPAQHIRNRVAAWFKGDFSNDEVFGDADVRKRYAAVIGVDACDYDAFLKGLKPKALMESDLFAAYVDSFKSSSRAKLILKKKLKEGYTAEDRQKELDDYVISEIKLIEAEKLRFFMLAEDNPQPVVVVKGPSDIAELKQFVGYEWSHRKGYEGMHVLGEIETEDGELQSRRGIDKINTLMFNPSDYDDSTKINKLIRDNFGGKEIVMPQNLEKYTKVLWLFDMIDFRKLNFDKVITGTSLKSRVLKSKWPVKRIGPMLRDVVGPITKVQESEIETSGKIPVISQEKDSFISGYVNKVDAITDLPLIVFGDHTCAVKYVDFPFVRGADGTQLIKVDSNAIATKYLYYFLSFTNQLNADRYERHMKYLTDCQIPVPPIPEQKKLVAACEKLDAKLAKVEKEVRYLATKKESSFDLLRGKATVRFSTLCKAINPAKTEVSKLPDVTMVSFVDMPSVSNDGFISKKDSCAIEDVRKGGYTYFAEGDVIVAKITPCMENGKCALAEGLENGVGFGSSEFHVFRAKDDVSNLYLFYFLNRASVRKAAEKVMTGASGHKRVPIEFYENLEVPKLSFAEQQKLAASIKAMEDKIISLRKEIENCRAEKAKTVEEFLK